MENPLNAAEEYVSTLGPGLITGAADDDPSGIATYSQVGAQYGYQMLWLSLFTFPLMAVIQEMCARIGIVTGQGLAANIGERYPRIVLYVAAALLFAANTFNLGADLGAMAKAVQLIWPSAHFILAIAAITIVSIVLQIFTTYGEYARYLKYLTFTLFSYVAAALLLQLDWGSIAWHLFVPHFGFSRDEILILSAVLGTTISPYLFFWQTSQEVEEEIQKGEVTIVERQAHVTGGEIRAMRRDVWSGMFFSNAIMFFIIVTCGATLFAHGVTDIATADQAALALRPLAGEFAYLLFALGILGTGMLAVPILAGSSAYAIAESFSWNEGLYLKLRDAGAFYGVIIAGMLAGFIMNIIGLDPIKALIWAAVGNAVVAPLMLYFIVRLSSDARVMGPYTNGRLANAIGWLCVAVMTVVSVAALAALT